MAKSSKIYGRIHRSVVRLLVAAREEAGLTQKDVAQSGIVSQSELSKLENGHRQIDFIILIQLAALYKKDFSFFIPQK